MTCTNAEVALGAHQHASANSQEQVAAGNDRCLYTTGSEAQHSNARLLTDEHRGGQATACCLCGR